MSRCETLLGTILVLLASAPAHAQAGAPPDPALRKPAQKTVEPPTPDVKAALAKIRSLYDQNRYGEAARLGELLTREHKDSLDAWLALASVHLAPDWPLRRDARAESAARRALQLGGHRPDIVQSLAAALFRQCKYDECLPLLNELIDATPQQLFGDSLADLFQLRAAVRIRRDPLDADAHEKALADLDHALSVSPSHASARRLRAEMRINDGKFAEALADLEVAVVSAPGDKSVHYEMHRCLARLKRPDEAKHHFEIWKRINALTDSTATTNAPDLSERRELLRQLKELNPADLVRRLQLADHELALGDADAAIRECDELLALRAKWPAAENLRGEALKAKAGAKPDLPSSHKDDGGDGG